MYILKVTDSYTIYASSALGGQSAVRLMIGSNFSLLAQPMYQKLGIHLAGTVLSALSESLNLASRSANTVMLEVDLNIA